MQVNTAPKLVLLDVGMVAELTSEDQQNLVGFFKVSGLCLQQCTALSALSCSWLLHMTHLSSDLDAACETLADGSVAAASPSAPGAIAALLCLLLHSSDLTRGYLHSTYAAQQLQQSCRVFRPRELLTQKLADMPIRKLRNCNGNM